MIPYPQYYSYFEEPSFLKYHSYDRSMIEIRTDYWEWFNSFGVQKGLRQDSLLYKGTCHLCHAEKPFV